MRNHAITMGVCVLGLCVLLMAPSAAVATVLVEGFEDYSSMPAGGWAYTSASETFVIYSSYQTQGDKCLVQWGTTNPVTNLRKTFSGVDFTEGGFDFRAEAGSGNFVFYVQDSALHTIGYFILPVSGSSPWTLSLNENYNLGSVAPSGDTGPGYHVDFEVDVDQQQMRARLGAGAWCDWDDFLATASTPDTLLISVNGVRCVFDNITGVPEPVTLSILALGGFGVLISRRRRG